MTITPLTRAEFEAAALEMGVQHPFGDARCFGEYRDYKATGKPYMDNEYFRLVIARGAALDAEGYQKPTPQARQQSGAGLVHREMQALTGLSSTGGDTCHYCGLDERGCDCR